MSDLHVNSSDLQGLRGNEARFINHGCNPNLEVRKYQTLGDGMEEYEVGMWALRDISAGEEVSKGLMRRDARRGVIDETALLQLQL